MVELGAAPLEETDWVESEKLELESSTVDREVRLLLETPLGWTTGEVTAPVALELRLETA